MGSAPTKYYIKVPNIGGGDDYVEIDPHRLHTGIVTQIYIRRRGRDHRNSFDPVSGPEGLNQGLIDLIGFEETLQDILQQYESVFAATPEGEQAWQEVIQKLDFSTIFTALSTGQVEAARLAFKNLLYKLLSELAEMVSQLSDHIEVTASMDEALVRYDETLVQSDNIADRYLFDWAEAADTLVSRCDQLDSIEQLLTNAREQIQRVRKTQQDLFERELSLDQLQALLEGDDDNDGFFLTTFAFLRDDEQGDKGGISQLAKTVGQRIAGQEEIIANAGKAWATAVDNRREEIVAQDAKIQRLIREMTDASQRLREHERRWGKETLRPYDRKSEGTPLITQSRYDQSQACLCESHWAPQTCKTRLSGLLNSVLGTIDQPPQPPAELVDLLQQANEYLNRVREAIESKKAKRAAPEKRADSQASPARKSTPRKGGGDAVTRVEVVPERADELFELMVCAAYALVCNHHFFAQSNSTALLETLSYLGRCNQVEVYSYNQELRQRMLAQTEEVEDRKQVVPRWKATQQMWVRYQPNPTKKLRGFKLSKAFTEHAQGLLAKHGLTVDEIKEARQLRHEAGVEAHRRKNVK